MHMTALQLPNLSSSIYCFRLLITHDRMLSQLRLQGKTYQRLLPRRRRTATMVRHSNQPSLPAVRFCLAQALSRSPPRATPPNPQPTESESGGPFRPAGRQQEGQRRSRPPQHGSGRAGREGSVRQDILRQRRQLRHRVRSNACRPSTVLSSKHAAASLELSLCAVLAAPGCLAPSVVVVKRVRPVPPQCTYSHRSHAAQVRDDQGTVAVRRARAVH